MTLLFGAVLTIAGLYLIIQRVTIYSGAYYWNRWGGGQEVFGLTLIPLLIGIGLLVYGKQLLGWAVTGAGTLVILLGILVNLRMTFVPSSLFEVILMFGMVAVGLALSARSVETSKCQNHRIGTRQPWQRLAVGDGLVPSHASRDGTSPSPTVCVPD